MLLATAVAAALTLLPPPQQTQVADSAPASRSVGRPNAGRLVRGVPFPPVGETFVTWDPVLHRSPDRVWRRYATVRTISRTLQVINAYNEAHPADARILVGDLSRPNGGPFGREYGGLGHASHQNGTDVDVYYPRKDGLELAARHPSQVDLKRSQWLVDHFVAAGAVYVFRGPHLALRGPRKIVQPLVYHDDHMHVRWPK